jgi:hypothetical protein
MLSGMICNGLVPSVNIVVNIIHANIVFIATQATRIMILFKILALRKLSLSLNVLGLFGSSPFSLTNHPRGIRLSVYCVPDLSVRNFRTLGGIQIQNSSTLTQLFLAAIKCHNS